MKRARRTEADAAMNAFAPPPKLTPEQETELCADWLSREPARERRFVDTFRLFVRAEVRSHWTRSWGRIDELEQEALLNLVEWRETPEGLEKIRPPVRDMVQRSVERLAKAMRREKAHLQLGDWDAPLDSTQEESLQLRETLDAAMSLPRGGSETLLAYVANEAGEGPELSEALGIDSASAHMRLVRAQAALLRKLQEDEEDNG